MTFKKGSALMILWADAAPAERGIADVPVGRGILSVARYAAVSGAPAFMELYELTGDAAADSRECRRLQEATEAACRRAGAEPRRGVYRQIFPAWVDARDAVHGPAAAIQRGWIDIAPEVEDEFNQWYASSTSSATSRCSACTTAAATGISPRSPGT